MTSPGIGCCNDRTNRLLIKAFEAPMALKVLQVTPQGALAHKLVVLRARDMAGHA